MGRKRGTAPGRGRDELRLQVALPSALDEVDCRWKQIDSVDDLRRFVYTPLYRLCDGTVSLASSKRCSPVTTLESSTTARCKVVVAQKSPYLRLRRLEI